MNNQIVGVDPSVASTFSVSSPTSTIENFTYSQTERTTEQIAPATPPSDPFANLPAGTYLGYIHSSNVQFFMAQLLGVVLSQVDASLPNKEQNRAMKHLLRKTFDKTLMDVHNMAWPGLSTDLKSSKGRAIGEATLGTLDNNYILQPTQ